MKTKFLRGHDLSIINRKIKFASKIGTEADVVKAPALLYGQDINLAPYNKKCTGYTRYPVNSRFYMDERLAKFGYQNLEFHTRVNSDPVAPEADTRSFLIGPKECIEKKPEKIEDVYKVNVDVDKDDGTKPQSQSRFHAISSAFEGVPPGYLKQPKCFTKTWDVLFYPLHITNIKDEFYEHQTIEPIRVKCITLEGMLEVFKYSHGFFILNRREEDLILKKNDALWLKRRYEEKKMRHLKKLSQLDQSSIIGDEWKEVLEEMDEVGEVDETKAEEDFFGPLYKKSRIFKGNLLEEMMTLKDELHMPKDKEEWTPPLSEVNVEDGMRSPIIKLGFENDENEVAIKDIGPLDEEGQKELAFKVIRLKDGAKTNKLLNDAKITSVIKNAKVVQLQKSDSETEGVERSVRSLKHAIFGVDVLQRLSTTSSSSDRPLFKQNKVKEMTRKKEMDRRMREVEEVKDKEQMRKQKYRQAWRSLPKGKNKDGLSKLRIITKTDGRKGLTSKKEVDVPKVVGPSLEDVSKAAKSVLAKESIASQQLKAVSSPEMIKKWVQSNKITNIEKDNGMFPNIEAALRMEVEIDENASTVMGAYAKNKASVRDKKGQDGASASVGGLTLRLEMFRTKKGNTPVNRRMSLPKHEAVKRMTTRDTFADGVKDEQSREQAAISEEVLFEPEKELKQRDLSRLYASKRSESDVQDLSSDSSQKNRKKNRKKRISYSLQRRSVKFDGTQRMMQSKVNEPKAVSDFIERDEMFKKHARTSNIFVESLVDDNGPTSRFDFPLNMTEMEDMKPMEYLKKHCTFVHRKHAAYTRVFKKFCRQGRMFLADIQNAVNDLLTGDLTKAAFEKVMTLTGLNHEKEEHISLDDFKAFCCFTERIVGKDQQPNGGHRTKGFLELADSNYALKKMREMDCNQNLVQIIREIASSSNGNS